MREGEVPVKVLIVEDDALVAQLIKNQLSGRGAITPEFRHAVSLEQASAALAEARFDVILLDLILPDSSGLPTFLAIRESARDIPVIILTGLDNEELALKALGGGAQDYIIKNESMLPLLERSIRYSIERKRAEEDLRKARDGLEQRIQERTRDLIRANQKLHKEIEERQQAQASLFQMEKMEVVGRMASGVAHEVRNPLAIILQSAEYLYSRLSNSDENIISTLKLINDSVMRADAIVTGLLDFSRISNLVVEPHDLNALIDNSLVLVNHQFNKHHIRVIKEYGADLPPARVDKNRIEQVIVNLMINAVDAMASGGELRVRTRREESASGMSIIVEIEDSGPGIPEAIAARIFDPFFTTKRERGGTGLGLSIVKTIMGLHKGEMTITNKEDGSGAIARLLFPV